MSRISNSQEGRHEIQVEIEWVNFFEAEILKTGKIVR
jgi:hypothetical protein